MDIRWIKDYLNDRYTSIKIHKSLSEAFRIPCGVPPGSHIGPILFVLFISDLIIYLNIYKICDKI